MVALTNSAGTKVVAYAYDAWGKVLSVTGSKASTIGQSNPLRYRGYVYDNETGLYYLGSRYYDPGVGRFINADTLFIIGQGIVGYNLFAYCLNNPISRNDQQGDYPSLNGFESLTPILVLPASDNILGEGVLFYKEHNKKGTTNPANRKKHQEGEARRQRDQRNEKGDRNREDRSNKRRRNTLSSLEKKIGAGLLLLGSGAGIVYLILNDATGVGIADDCYIAPMGNIFVESLIELFR